MLLASLSAASTLLMLGLSLPLSLEGWRELLRQNFRNGLSV